MDITNASIVVTGGAGFLGSRVAEALRGHGARKVFVPRSRDYNLVEIDAIRRLLADSRPDLAIHLAGNVGVIGANSRNPGSFFYNNLMMGTQLIDESRKAGVAKIVLSATVCAYPKFTPVPFKEDDLWNGYPEETNAPYGLAKKMLLVQAQAYREQYGTNAIVLIPVNLYGPGDNFDLETSHAVPALIRKIDAAIAGGHRDVVIWGDGTPTRELLYVDDAAEAFVLASERYDDRDPVNIGTGRETSIRELAGMIGGMMGFRGNFTYDTSRPNGQPRRCLDVSRAAERFGFRAQVGLEEGLARTIDWWRREAR